MAIFNSKLLVYRRVCVAPAILQNVIQHFHNGFTRRISATTWAWRAAPLCCYEEKSRSWTASLFGTVGDGLGIIDGLNGWMGWDLGEATCRRSFWIKPRVVRRADGRWSLLPQADQAFPLNSPRTKENSSHPELIFTTPLAGNLD